MKLVYGTTNPAKLKSMRDKLDGLGIDILGLREVCVGLEPVDESGNDPLENARIKALAYYKALGMPVFSCDSGLYIDGIDLEDQPGVHVRRVGGRELNDEEMIEHYTSLAVSLGGAARARYKNAICVVKDENNIYEYDGDDICSEYFLIASEAHPDRTKGFPLDSISLEIETGKYYMDLEEIGEGKHDIGKGFRSFFSRTILK